MKSNSHQTIEPARPLVLTNWAFNRMESTSSNPTHLEDSFGPHTCKNVTDQGPLVIYAICARYERMTYMKAYDMQECHPPGSIGDVGSKVASIHNCLPGLRSGTWQPGQPAQNKTLDKPNLATY